MKYLLFLFIMANVFIFTGCEKGTDFSNNPPRINLITPSLSGPVGGIVIIKADLEDDYVLKYVKLKNTALGLDQTIYISIKNVATKADLDVIKSSENFSYNFTIPNTAVSGDTYEITMEVKNATGQISSVTINLTIS